MSAVSEDVEDAAGSTLCFQSLSNFADDLLNCKVVRLNEGYSYVLSELKRDALSPRGDSTRKGVIQIRQRAETYWKATGNCH